MSFERPPQTKPFALTEDDVPGASANETLDRYDSFK